MGLLVEDRHKVRKDLEVESWCQHLASVMPLDPLAAEKVHIRVYTNFQSYTISTRYTSISGAAAFNAERHLRTNVFVFS